MLQENVFALRGTLAHTPTMDGFAFYEDAYLVCASGEIEGIYQSLPERLAGVSVLDYSGKIIVPGMADMHMHAPQYAFRGMGVNMEREGSDWFKLYAFPDESRYADPEYARSTYTRFVEDLSKTTTTRACIFGTIHRPSTELLMELLAERGFDAYVGKVNMDRNSIPGLLETTQETLDETRQWLEDCGDGRFGSVKPIITPRYIPTSTDESLDGLGRLAAQYHVPVQSHLSELLSEVEWVRRLHPNASCYGDAYDRFGLFGDPVPTVMAHCVHPTGAEFALLQRRNVMIAHCPQSNTNLGTGVAPVQKMLDAGIRVGLGSDMAGSNTLSLLRAITDAIQASKMKWALTEQGDDPSFQRKCLTLAQAFYLATKGGGAFWGKAGSFEKGYLFDAVVIDDTSLRDLNRRTTYERLERIIMTADDRNITAKFINGRQVLGAPEQEG